MPGGHRSAALGPADHRKPAHALRVQPGAFLAGGEIDVGLGPFARPEILRAVEAGGPHPVLQRELAGVADLQPALLGRIDEEQPAEGTPRLPAKRLLGLLVDDQHALAGVGELGGRDQPRQAAADNDDVRFVRHRQGFLSRERQRRPAVDDGAAGIDHNRSELLQHEFALGRTQECVVVGRDRRIA